MSCVLGVSAVDCQKLWLCALVNCLIALLLQTRSVTITGTFVSKIVLQTSGSWNNGLVISPDSARMVTSHSDDTLSVYSLPSGEHIRTFGSKGTGEGQFQSPVKLCFSVAGNILVAESNNMRVQELTLTGDHVRFIGVGVIFDPISGIAANAELIVVGMYACISNNRIMMFDAVTGVFVRAFGDCGDAPGQLMKYCQGIRFTPDSRHIIVAESNDSFANGRLSVFTLAGEFVRCIGEGELKAAYDIEFAASVDIIGCDGYPKHRIYVYSADGSTLLRHWGGAGFTDGKFKCPLALAMCGGQLYVLDQWTKRVQVFE